MSMKLHLLILLLELLIASSLALHESDNRRILHQPLLPISSSPPTVQPPPPPQPDQPFFPEAPDGEGSQNQSPVLPTRSANGSEPIPAATQPANPTKKVAIVVSVGIASFGLLCIALSFYVYSRHKMKHRVEEEDQRKLESHGYRAEEELATTTAPPSSSFLYIGTVDHSNQTSAAATEDTSCSPPYHKFNPVKKLDRYRPSPDLQPLPPLSRRAPAAASAAASAATTLYSSAAEEEDEDEGSNDMAFYTPHGSIASSMDEGFSIPVVSRQTSVGSSSSSIPFSKRRKFGAPPPPPNLALLQSISYQSDYPQTVSATATSRPTPPPPPLRPSSRKEKAAESGEGGEGISSTRLRKDDTDGSKPKLKPLHWDKVRATSDRDTVWDHLKPSSFQLNEDRMESLFGSNSFISEPTRRSALPPAERQHRILDPKKSQNIAILLRALNVTREEVSQALLDGNPEALGAEQLETLAKMAPSKEEEIKLKGYMGDSSKLGSAEKFLKAVLDVPFAFQRVEAMLYRVNFDAEVKYIRKSFEILEEASSELRNSRLFFKLLEAVLTTGNRMNVGTNRGDAQSFKLDTLLKLVDIKGVDRKTTLLHFVVQEIVRCEGMGSTTTTSILGKNTSSKAKEEEFRRQGLQVVSGLTREIPNVKLAAGMDSDVLHNYVSKLETGLEHVRTVLQYESLDRQGRFFESMKAHIGVAEEEICRIKEGERKALNLVREVTQYFHGDAAKEESHPLRIFMIVRDFLLTLDHVCKDVGTMQNRPVMGAARSFHISSNASFPVHSRYNITRNDNSSEESSSPGNK